MDILLYAGAAVTAYLIAGINPAILLSNGIYHKDIRTCGSGNPGFTNFKRVFGSKWAWWVLVLDLSKGAAVTAFFASLFAKQTGSYQLGAAFTGLFAVLGHVYPVWYRFKGGKGFLVYLSVIWLIDWRAGLTALVLMLVLLAATKYMSLSTVTAMLSCPPALFVLHAEAETVCLCAASVLLIAWRHRENFKRLANGTEAKFSLKSRPPAHSL